MVMASKVTSELLVEQRGRVVWLTIDREERRNAMTGLVITGLADAIESANRARDVHAIVITGRGEKAFCAGADLQSGASFKFDYSEPIQPFSRMLRSARESNVPLIARVNGACMAGGMGLLAMCDMAVAATHATFGVPEVKLGLFPAQVHSVMRDLLPQRVWVEMCLTGERLTASRAREIGLINGVADGVDDALNPLLDRLLDVSPAGIRRGLYTIKQGAHMTFEQSIAFNESQIALFALTEDATEGQCAFREKRRPNWTGR